MKKSLLFLASMLLVVTLSSCGNKAISEKDLNYTMSDDGSGVIILEYTGKTNAKTLIVPDTIEGLPVVAVQSLVPFHKGEYESYNVYGIKSIKQGNINDTVKRIEFPDTVKKLPVMWNCIALEYVKLPKSLEPLNDLAAGINLSGCINLKEVVIPEGITHVGDLSNTGLKSVTLPSTLKRICEYAFSNCRNLEEVIIPESITSLDFTFEYGDFDSCFEKTNLDLKEQAKIRNLGYKGQF